MSLKFFLFAAAVLALSVFNSGSSAQRRQPGADQPITGDFKITVKTTAAGQTTQTTTMIKGRRERSETNMAIGGMNMSQVSITQCDMRRIVQVNDRARKYMITPMDSDNAANQSTSSGANAGPVTRGGVITMTVNTVDTGERKEMFGFTARHLKRSMTSSSSPDACNQQQMKIETDGWYINLEYGLNCGSMRPAQMGSSSARGGCQDRYQYKQTGPANLGYPLVETMTMYGPDGNVSFTTTREVVEISRQPLDAALFDIPAGYSEARTQQEMYASSMADMMAQQQAGRSKAETGETSAPSVNTPANPGAKVKVGVVEFENKTKASLSTDELRQRLIATLVGDGIDAIALNAGSPGEAEVEARAKGCAYILYTDIASLKTPSTGRKIGGLLGRATGADSGNAAKAESRFDYRLVKTGSTAPTLQASASGKETTQDESVNAALQAEAQAIAAALPRM